MDYCASMKNLEAARRSPNFKFVRGDIRSLDFLTFVLSEEKVDTVLHFAAQTHVDNSFGNSLRFAEVHNYLAIWGFGGASQPAALSLSVEA